MFKYLAYRILRFFRIVSLVGIKYDYFPFALYPSRKKGLLPERYVQSRLTPVPPRQTYGQGVQTLRSMAPIAASTRPTVAKRRGGQQRCDSSRKLALRYLVHILCGPDHQHLIFPDSTLPDHSG